VIFAKRVVISSVPKETSNRQERQKEGLDACRYPWTGSTCWLRTGSIEVCRSN